MTTRSRAHLPALSSRLPIRSVRSCDSPRNRRPSGDLDRKGERAVAIDLLERAHEAVDHRPGRRSPRRASWRAPPRARDRDRSSPAGASPPPARAPSRPSVGLSASASLTMTLSGVFSAWARLPTCVRARSTTSRLASSSRLTSAASGATSWGKSPLMRSASPRRIGRQALAQHAQRPQPEAHRQRRRADQRHRQNRGRSPPAHIRSARSGCWITSALAATCTRKRPSSPASISRCDHAQRLVAGPVDIAAPDAVAVVGGVGVAEARQLGAEQRMRGADFGRRAGRGG